MMAESHQNTTQNTTTINETSATFDISFIYDPRNISAYAISAILMLAALTFLSVILWVLRRVPKKSLKPKFLLINVLLSDYIMMLGIGGRGLRNILMHTSQFPATAYSCFEVWIFVSVSWSSLHISLSSWLLAADRFASVVFPFKYMVINYTRVVNARIMAGMLVVSIGLPLVIGMYEMLSREDEGDSWAVICQDVYGSATIAVVPMALIILFILTIITHCVTLVSVCTQKARFPSQGSADTLRENARMANTFLLIYLSYCGCILPAPIYFVMNRYMWKIVASDTVVQVLALAFSVNAVVDPIIITMRVPAVKRGLMMMRCIRRNNEESRLRGIVPAIKEERKKNQRNENTSHPQDAPIQGIPLAVIS